MPTKRSFTDFQDSLGSLDHAPPSPSPSSFRDSTYGSASPRVQKPRAYIKQDLATRQEPKESHPEFPLLRSRTSLPNLHELRTLHPLTLLTSKNLCAMDHTHLPPTPTKTTSDVSYSTPTGSSSKSTTDSDDGRKMAMVGLLDTGEGERRLQERPSFKEAIDQIVGGGRASAMKTESVQAYAAKLEKLKLRNEMTIAQRLMAFLVKEERSVEGETSAEIVMPKGDADKTTLRKFELDHLDYSIDKDFRRDSVPYPTNQTEPASYYGIRNPKPDYAYGFDIGAFTTQQQKGLLTFEPELSRGIASPFLVIEWKGFAGKMQKAKDQVRRAGAAMVHSRRQAMARIPGAPKCGDELDLATMAFTCTINEVAAHIHVHWAQEAAGGEGTEWLMAVVERKFVDAERDIRDMRRILHNILDWGLEIRLALVQKQVDAYMEQIRTQAVPLSSGISWDEGGGVKRRRL